ncbi:MAG: S41 family peptidase, partial [Candidatus Pacebacteria bacterium]|nr:S41 family peptidase [Candidatus Paceibacterota bacterium]
IRDERKSRGLGDVYKRQILNDKSIHANKVTDQDRVWGAISGLASSMGDPYTVFFPPKENKSFNEEILGSFDGIGAEIGIKDKILTIIAPLKDTPAWNAGIKAGDKILKIDDATTVGMTIDEAIDLIHGPSGTVVVLLILRSGENETREISIIRGRIQIPTIDTELREDNIFVIKLYNFSEKSDNLFKEAIIEFINSKSSKLILDLRGNPGGYLGSSVNIASWFIDEGKTILVEDSMDGSKPKVYRSHGPRLFNENLSFVVLVDGGSASASEILAGALREHGIATLVGEKTFGKGSVQELIKITEDTSLKVTVANWKTPNGISISPEGLEPDVKIPFTKKDSDAKRDPQMDKAVEILNAE